MQVPRREDQPEPSAAERARLAWVAAAEALDDAGRALSSVPGAAEAYTELCALADRTQMEGRDILGRAIDACRKQAVDTLPPEWRGK